MLSDYIVWKGMNLSANSMPVQVIDKQTPSFIQITNQILIKSVSNNLYGFSF